MGWVDRNVGEIVRPVESGSDVPREAAALTSATTLRVGGWKTRWADAKGAERAAVEWEIGRAGELVEKSVGWREAFR